MAKNNGGIFSVLKAYIDRRRLGELLVIKGLISTQDLRFALGRQKQTRLPLGQIFLKHAMISRRQLMLILGRQFALRCVAASVFFLAALTNSSGKKVRADFLNQNPAQLSITVPVAANAMAGVTSYPALFGTAEKRSGNLGPFTKWSGMFARYDRQMHDPNSSKALKQWQENLDSVRGQSIKAMATRVNDLANQTQYIVDSRNWGQSDYWETPVEFIQRGGDCEDFAIAKYMALRSLGVPEERLRIAIVHDTVKNIPHALLIVYTDEGAYFLDNQMKTIVDAGSAGRYRPIFSINREAWWLHTQSSTQVASAQ